MGHRRSATYWFNLFGAAGLVLAALVGCSGDNGAAGTPGMNAVATTPASSSSISALSIAITGVTVASPPVVTFKVTDQYGTPVSGLLPDNLRFTIAKLIPGSAANGNLDNWQNYVVRVSGGRIQGNRETPSAANLTDNGDGTYRYTFQTDITNVTCPASPCNDSYGNPIDLSYNASLTHRVGMQIRRGSSTLPLANATYTFRPSDGATTGITLRDIVKTAKCNQCHATLQAHDQRIETKYCVTCHNPGTTANGQVGTVQGDMPVDFKVMIHKIHRGEELPSSIGPDGIAYTADDYDSVAGKNTRDYGVIGYSGTLQSFKEVAFPQDIRNCTKCHDGSDPETPQGDRWTTRPSRAACGSCHDDVNFDTGVGHGGGVQTDDAICALCHNDPVGFPALYVPTVHLPVEMTNTTPGSEAGVAANQSNLPTGAAKVEYQIKSVAVNPATVGALATNLATVEFRILMDGTPVTLSTPGTLPVLANFSGGPRFYISYAVPMDSITSPADFNYSGNVTLDNIWNGTQGTFVSGPDADGYYKVEVGGGTSAATGTKIPSTAKMVTAWMLYPFVQTNLPDYPGGLTLITPAVQKAATGYTARRTIVVRENCNNCHSTLGTEPTFHGGSRNDPQICNICHYPQRTSNGWAARSNAFVHMIHGASKRTVDFTWHGTAATPPVLIDRGYWQIAFPGILKNCQACHVSGGYDFSGSAYTETLMSSLPYSVVASGTMSPTSFTRSPYVDATGTVNYGSNFSYNAGTDVTTQAAGTTLATSPISTACFACHDTTSARAHMEANGGSIYLDRTTALTRQEQCLVCHGPGKVAAIAAMHAK